MLAELPTLAVFYFFVAAFLVGFTKTSVGGMGILAVLLMALAFPGKASPGILLPMALTADIFAVLYYRRSCQWGVIAKIFPLTAVGVLIGYFTVDMIPQELFEKSLGYLILLMLGLSLYIEKRGADLSNNKSFTAFMGIAAGIATMMGNAAGPIFGIYLLQMGLPKKDFVGTRAWFFLLINIFKIPFSAHLGLITFETLKLDATAIPIILLGAFCGCWFLKIINLEVFKWLIRLAVVLAAIRLLFF
ncbi:MAG: sulfite exporter TauE/SafE family protein [Rhizobiaceae bacterium]